MYNPVRYRNDYNNNNYNSNINNINPNFTSSNPCQYIIDGKSYCSNKSNN